MKSLRKLLKDRWSGGLLAAAITYFLAVQGLAGAIAQGSAAGSLQDPNFIICSSLADHGRNGDPTAPSEDGDHHAFCAVWSLPADERTAREAALRSLVGDRLLRAASHRAWRSDLPQARTLLRHAARLHWPSVLGSQGLRATALTFGGAAVGRGLKRLTAGPGPG